MTVASPAGGADATPFDLLRAVAAHGLPGAPPLPAAPGGLARWRELVALAERHRILGFLVAAVADGALTIDDDQRDELLGLNRQWCSHDLRLERLLLTVADRLDDQGVPYVVLKGPVLAHGCYPDPAIRLFADLDLLVPSGQVAVATAIVAGATAAEVALPELRPGFDERFGKEVLLRTEASTATPSGMEIDVHRTLVAGALGLTIPLDRLFGEPGRFELAGRSLPALAPVHLLLAACYQASIADHPPRLCAARDLAELVRATPVTPAELMAEAHRWQATAVVSDAFARTWRTLDLTPDPFVAAWTAAARPTRREQMLVAAHQVRGYLYWRHLAALLVLPGLEPRVRYLAAVAAPQASYLDRRTYSWPAHARRGWRMFNRPVREAIVRAARRFRRRFWPPG